jgi:hypothetical protein
MAAARITAKGALAQTGEPDRASIVAAEDSSRDYESYD